ncbi:hypothetical protein SAMN04487820_11142 [Actinopolyspora mzabensis]|uniref:Uncharacterized protein n=1 Tax=Actinopolyspora mzabensis TaxID=995066 RepID=A0A1G9E076_ACTMZ|nr:hypothetical protein [Actinopolyspora mzabensis]SDK69537.1 hypothetical protein SAMN04487820_11142 [Actinopolyspora mzabensis]
MRTSVRTMAIASIAAGFLAVGSPALAEDGKDDQKNAQAPVTVNYFEGGDGGEATGGNGGNGGDVECENIVKDEAEATIYCVGGDGGNGGDATGGNGGAGLLNRYL